MVALGIASLVNKPNPLTFEVLIVKKEQHNTITSEKFSVLIKNPSYQWQGRTLILQPMSYRWIVQTLKKHPDWTLEDLKQNV